MKGANAEREVISHLQPIVDAEYKRVGLEPPELKRNLFQTREGGHDIVGIDWLAMEVKRQENLSINTWWSQTIRQAEVAGGEPVLIYKQSRKPWRVIMFSALKCGHAKYMKVRSEVSFDDFKKYVKWRIRTNLEG